MSDLQLNSTTVSSFRDPVLPKNDGPSDLYLAPDIKRRVGDSSLKDDRTTSRLEKSVQRQRQLREERRNASAEMRQSMVEFQRRLEKLEEEIRQGRVLREELNTKLDEELDALEAGRALVSSMLQ